MASLATVCHLPVIRTNHIHVSRFRTFNQLRGSRYESLLRLLEFRWLLPNHGFCPGRRVIAVCREVFPGLRTQGLQFHCVLQKLILLVRLASAHNQPHGFEIAQYLFKYEFALGDRLPRMRIFLGMPARRQCNTSKKYERQTQRQNAEFTADCFTVHLFQPHLKAGHIRFLRENSFAYQTTTHHGTASLTLTLPGRNKTCGINAEHALSS
ncbi:MAG TPA: hypothetical protein VMV97_10420 [Sulfuriferula sp.]|nr:hypothetical protein [Sulfuriferula sp.]